MRVIYLGEEPGYIEEVAKLIESQWKKGLAYRINRLTTFNTSPSPFSAFPQNFCLSSEEKVVAQVTIKRVLPPKESYLYMESLVVEEKERGKGYGKKLVDFLIAQGPQHGFTGIVLKTMHAKGFYEKLGFQPCLPMHIQQGKKKLAAALFQTAIQPTPGEHWLQFDFSAKIEKRERG